MKWPHFLERRTTKDGSILSNIDSGQANVPDYRDSRHFTGNLDNTLEYLASYLGISDDYMVRVLSFGGVPGAICFISTVCDQNVIKDTINAITQHQFPKRKPKAMAQYLIENVLPVSDALFMVNLFEIREAIASGDTVIFLDKTVPAIVLGTSSVEHRAPEQPTIESSSRGSQISFVENLDINVGLIRTHLKTDSLVVKKFKLGYRSRTEVAVLFMSDVANPVAVETVVRRLNAIHVDVISQSSAVEQRIVDNHWTPFPLVRTTQRIDSVARTINQGKVAIITDGDPTVLQVPATMQDFFQTEEDYAHKYTEATIIRLLRIIAFMLAVYLPSLYIAFVDFNPELLPKSLGLQIAQSRQGVPFPAVIEVVIMQIVVEILREATLRMPKQMGQTIGIVGGLVLGEASVQAGLVSNILIIIISLTAISVFVTPSYEFSTVIRMATWIMVVAATMLGLYGVVLASVLVFYHVSSLKSFGISYMDPYNGEHLKNILTDGLTRIPVWAMEKRASHLHILDDDGEGDYVNPVPHPQLETSRKKPFIGRGGRR